MSDHVTHDALAAQLTSIQDDIKEIKTDVKHNREKAVAIELEMAKYKGKFGGFVFAAAALGSLLTTFKSEIGKFLTGQ